MELTSGAQTQIAKIVSEQLGATDDTKQTTKAIIEMIEKGQFDASTFAKAKMINPAVDAVLSSDQIQNSVKAALVNTVEINQSAIDSISIAPSVASTTRVGTYSVPHAPEKDFTSGNRFFERSSYVAVISILTELADLKEEIARAYDDFTGDATLRLFNVARQDALLESERASKEIKEVYKTTQGALIQAIMAGVGLLMVFMPGSFTKVMKMFKEARSSMSPTATGGGASTAQAASNSAATTPAPTSTQAAPAAPATQASPAAASSSQPATPNATPNATPAASSADGAGATAASHAAASTSQVASAASSVQAAPTGPSATSAPTTAQAAPTAATGQVTIQPAQSAPTPASSAATAAAPANEAGATSASQAAAASVQTAPAGSNATSAPTTAQAAPTAATGQVTIQPAQSTQTPASSAAPATTSPQSSPRSDGVSNLASDIKLKLDSALTKALNTKAGTEQASTSSSALGQITGGVHSQTPSSPATQAAPASTPRIEPATPAPQAPSSSNAGSNPNQGNLSDGKNPAPVLESQPNQVGTSQSGASQTQPIQDAVVSSNSPSVAPLKSPLEQNSPAPRAAGQDADSQTPTAVQPPKPKQDTSMVGAREKGETGRDGLGSTQPKEPPRSVVENLDLQKTVPAAESKPLSAPESSVSENPAATPIAHKESPQAAAGSKMIDGGVSEDIGASDMAIKPDQTKAMSPPKEAAVKQEMQKADQSEVVSKENPVAAGSNLGAQEQVARAQPKDTVRAPSEETVPTDRVSSSDNTPRIEPLEGNEGASSASLKDAEIAEGAGDSLAPADGEGAQTRPAQEATQNATEEAGPSGPSNFRRKLGAVLDGAKETINTPYRALKEHDLSGLGDALVGAGEQANQIVIAKAKMERAQEEKELMRSLEMTKSYKNMLSQEVRSFRDESLNVAREFNSIIESIRSAAMQHSQEVAQTAGSHSA